MHSHTSSIRQRLLSACVAPLLLCLSLLMPAQKCAAQYDLDYISYADFYETLAPYGQWIDDPQFGFVWSPGEDINFRPYYTNGHWVMTEYGNTWISDYPWGWACFHYGRWTYDEYYGWLWLPDGQWGPAWVSWRYGEGYYGWAPMGPANGSATPVTSTKCPSDWWVFIPSRYLYSGSYYRFWYGPRDNKKYIKTSAMVTNTFVKGNTSYVTGPSAAQVKQVTGAPVQVYKVRNSKNHNTRVHGEEVRMFRPEEIPKAPKMGEAISTPPRVISAPRPIHQPQAVTANSGAVSPFREAVISRNNGERSTPGTNINQTAEPQPASRADNNPYEWDVSRSVKQDYTPPPRTARPQQPAPPKPATRPPARRPQQPRSGQLPKKVIIEPQTSGK